MASGFGDPVNDPAGFSRSLNAFLNSISTKNAISITRPPIYTPTIPTIGTFITPAPKVPAFSLIQSVSSAPFKSSGSAVQEVTLLSSSTILQNSQTSFGIQRSRASSTVVEPSYSPLIKSSTSTQSTIAITAIAQNAASTKTAALPYNSTNVSSPTRLVEPESSRDTLQATRSTLPASAPSSASTAARGTSVGMKAAIALGVIIFALLVSFVVALLWRRKRRRRRGHLLELPASVDHTKGRFELAATHSKTTTCRGSSEKASRDISDATVHPVQREVGISPLDEKSKWRPWRLSRWRGREELDGGWRPPEMQGRKFHEKSVP